jgi:hypothetical protein
MLIVPSEALHVTAVFTAPETVAVNCTVCPAKIGAMGGFTITEISDTVIGALHVPIPAGFVGVIV